MVHIRYVKRGNKKFGPYYYESYRSGDKVKKRYIGDQEQYDAWLSKKNKKQKKNMGLSGPKKSNKIGLFFIGFIFIVYLLFVVGYFGNNLTGFVTDTGYGTGYGTEYEEVSSNEISKIQTAGFTLTDLPGEGIESNPFIISNCSDLNKTRENLTAYYQLTDNIDCSDTINWNDGEGFEPIGNSSHDFNGTFDGNGHTINQLFINRSTTDYVGLFRSTGYSEIKNIGLIDAYISGNNYVGALVGLNNGNISECFSRGEVNGSGNYIGGLAGYHEGYNFGLINNSYSNANVKGTSNVGGFIGRNDDPIDNSYATGNVSGSTNVGGFAGAVYSIVRNSFSTGNVTGNYGFIGYADGNPTNSYWNNNSGNGDQCHDVGDAGCTAISDNEAYFYDVSNPPMDSWDFTNVWSDFYNGSSFPSLRWELNLTDCGTLDESNAVYFLQKDISITSGNCFTISGYNVTLDLNGFNITGSFSPNHDGIFISNDKATIQNGGIHGFSKGISFGNIDNGNGDLRAENLTLLNNSYGIYGYESDSFGNIIVNSKIKGCGNGIYLRNGDIDVINCNITDTGSYGIYLAILWNDVRIINNTISGDEATSHGISLRTSFRSIISGNIIEGHEDGIQIKNSDYTNITENIIRNNSDEGINIETNSANNFVYGNDIINNSDAGIQIQSDGGSCLYNVIVFNNISFNGDDGVRVTESQQNANNITHNYIFHNGNCTGSEKGGGDGIAVDGPDFIYIFNNTILDNCDDGVELDDISRYDIVLNNTINYNHGDGIHIEAGSMRNIIENNTVSYNGDEGMQIETISSHNTIVNNFVNQNKDHSIIIKTDSNNVSVLYNVINASGSSPDETGDSINIKTDNNRIIGNNISYGSDDGIKLDGANSNFVANNTLKYNQDKSVHLINSSYNNISDNYAIFNSHGYLLQDNSTNNIFRNNIAINNSQQGFYIKAGGNINNEFYDSYACCNYGDFDIYDLGDSLFQDYTCGEDNGYNKGICTSLCTENCTLGCEYDISASTIINQDYNCFTDGFIITTDNIVFDCNFSSIRGANKDHSGILVDNQNNITIKNCFISNFEKGVYFNNSGDSLIFNNTLSSNRRGFRFRFGLDNIALDNLIRDNDDGIEFESSSNNQIINNTILRSEDEGIQVELQSNYNNFSGNIIQENLDKGLKIESDSINNSIFDNIFINNSVDLLVDVNSLSFINITNISFSVRNLLSAGVEWENPLSLYYSGLLSDMINISFNYVFINSSALSNLNQSARIEMFNTDSLGFDDRYPLRNGVDCPSSICTELQDSDTYIFDVAYFTTYSLSGSSSSPGGGNGCTPDCSDAQDYCEGTFFPDGCGGLCEGTRVCCVPYCVGKECGGDGCGGSCGSCPSGESCSSGRCVGDRIAEDIETPKRDDCDSDFECGEWSECDLDYNIFNLISEKDVKGIQTRTCKDKNKCVQDYIDSKLCSLKEEIVVEKTLWCNQEYIDIKSISGNVIARLRKTEGDYLNVNLNLIGEGYCAYCYDSIQNYDEEGVDCGGSCKPCLESRESPKIKIPYNIILFLIVIIALSILILSYILKIALLSKKRNQLLKKYEEWKRKGYDVSILENEIKLLKSSKKIKKKHKRKI